MALLLDTSTTTLHPIRTHHTLGRSAERVDTVLRSSKASRLHAALLWDGRSWTLRDLSKNGTWVNDRRVSPGKSVPLASGDGIRFGCPNSYIWKLEEDSAPRSLLIGLNSCSDTIELSPFQFLPNEDEPQSVLTYDARRSVWSQHPIALSDQSEPERFLAHGDILLCSGRQWRVFLMDSSSATEYSSVQDTLMDEFEFVFDLSLDEENTSLQLQHPLQTVNLGERSHHYLLLHLARLRASEAVRGIDPKSQGWINTEQLARDLGVDIPHINILIFRARKQLAQTLTSSLNSENLVERGRGRLRFGYPRFSIYKGERLEFKLPLAETP